MMTGTTPSGTRVELSHEFVADSFWEMSNAIERHRQIIRHLVGMEEIADELAVQREHWRGVAVRIDANAAARAATRAATATERLMQD